MCHDNLGRFSFIGSDPFLVLKICGDSTTLNSKDQTTIQEGDPFEIINGLLNTYQMDCLSSGIPFTGGAVGYFSYDLCRFIEHLPHKAIDDLQLPDCCLGFYDTILAFDNLLKETCIVSTGFPELDEISRLERAHRRVSEIEIKLGRYGNASQAKGNVLTNKANNSLISNFTRSGYIEAVNRARDYIVSGDIFEVNLSQRFESELTIEPYQLYYKLRALNPAPFAAYLGFDEVAVVSASPERFLRKTGDLLETRPIKGTRPRGKTAEEDATLAKELMGSSKDIAENTMIVDLERNDLGRICRYGTVRVPELAILETYPTVFHLTSTVRGLLRKDKKLSDILKATFPGGSITGAPKIRSMQIIDELEPTRRSIYTGSIGYLGFNGDIDLNIAIRTILVKGNRAYFQAGGAVTYKSDPDAEYMETLNKAKALMAALDCGAEVLL